MNDELRFLSARAAVGKYSRRDFLGRAAALGVSAAAANTLLSSSVMAAGPQKGGTMRVGISGGSASDSLDPALSTNPTTSQIIRMWGEPLVELAPGGLEPRVAESFSASADARVWTFKIRSGVTFSNGKTVTAEDVLATMERHSGEDTKSGALGIMRGIKSMRAEGMDFIVELELPNADLPYLLTDYHLMI